MDYTKVLKQAWKNVISYRALWIFGIILTLTTVSTTNSMLTDQATQDEENREGLMGTGVTIDVQPGENFWEAFGDAFDEMGKAIEKDIGDADRELTKFFREVIGLKIKSDLVKLFTILLWTFLVLYIAGKVFQYISETALISMVNDQEETGEQLRTRDGFRLGWSRTSWRLFLIDLMIGIPTAIVFIILFGVVFTPLFLLALGITEVSIFSGFLTGGLFFIFIFLAIIMGQVIGVVKYFARRECAVEKLGPLDSIRRGFRMVWDNLKNVGIMWLVMVGVNIGWPVLMGIFTILLIAVDILVSGLTGMLVGLTSNAFGGAEPILVGAIVGISIFMIILILPLVFLGGLKEVFQSSTWTLTYRELKALSSMTAEAVPVPIEE